MYMYFHFFKVKKSLFVRKKTQVWCIINYKLITTFSLIYQWRYGFYWNIPKWKKQTNKNLNSRRSRTQHLYLSYVNDVYEISGKFSIPLLSKQWWKLVSFSWNRKSLPTYEVMQLYYIWKLVQCNDEHDFKISFSLST